MKVCCWRRKIIISLAAVALALPFWTSKATADPSKYPEFAQQTVPPDVKLVFINIEELVTELKAGVRPVIIDVRSPEEFQEVHILGAVSAPLAEFKNYIKSIPRDRPVVLY
jgi:Rhodanese-like domain